ncbi:uncharacterized protein LOC101236399 isoform X3 [Hydra vulgaris]|uniref:Uncharacterized protein LOC101236399 isoform X3 n=2 Tax=Hydra vulgaris TaxID=6087 RepID=A0ABM4DNJ1_HYDVU
MKKRTVSSCQNSLIWKLNRAQLFGGVQHPGTNKKLQYFEAPCAKNQIKLKLLQNKKVFNNGHIFLGFSADGQYLVSYRCEMITDVDLMVSVRYQYFLYWWLFHLWKPLQKIRKVELFVNENISQELHLLFCESFQNEYIVVHGSTYNSNDYSENGSLCYLSVIPTNVNSESKYAINLRYELLPPYPPLMISVCVKLKNVILLNSGDMLFAIILNGGNCFISKNVFQSKLCYCGIWKYSVPKIDNFHKIKEKSELSDVIVNEENNISSFKIPSCVSYVIQGFSLQNEEELEESPESFFDCTSIVLPVQVFFNDKRLNVSCEHRCFAHQSNSIIDADFVVGQAQFNAETFLNEKIQETEEVKERYVSLRDYDMQFVEVCETTNEVVILLNALVILRENVCGDVLNQRSNKLLLYRFGYIVTWNVYTNRITVLHAMKPILDGVGSENKSQNFSPSLSAMIQLRKKWFIPVGKHASVQSLSNHTVFTGSSLPRIHHPFLPITIVM